MVMRKMVLIVTMVFSSWSMYGGSVYAEDAAGSTTLEDTARTAHDKLPQTIIEYIIVSGMIGWFLCALSIVTLALIIEAIVTIKREKLIPEDVLADLEEMLQNHEYEQAIELCEAEPTLLTQVVGAGLRKVSMGVDRMAEAMAEEADARATLLYQKIGYINLIAGVSPMIGLFGTVQGMIMSFEKIAVEESANAQMLAGGIMLALLTTFEALLVAVPALAAFQYLRGRVVKVLLVLSMVMGDILDRFRSAEN